MPIKIANDKIAVTNAAGDLMECNYDAKFITMRVAGCEFQLTFGEAETLGDWMLEKVDDAVATET